MHIGIFTLFLSCSSESLDSGNGVSSNAPEVLFYTATGEDCCGEDPHPVHGVETSDGGFVDQSEGEGTAGYGYKYNFQTALSTDGTIVLPPNTSTPTVFELKNPNQNIQGRVR